MRPIASDLARSRHARRAWRCSAPRANESGGGLPRLHGLEELLALGEKTLSYVGLRIGLHVAVGACMRASEGTVWILGAASDTGRDLSRYLAAAGHSVFVAKRDVLPRVGPGVASVVLFPDDLSHSRVVAWLGKQSRQTLRLVIVTARHAARFTAGTTSSVIVLARPAFGWVILDAIRGLPGPAH